MTRTTAGTGRRARPMRAVPVRALVGLAVLGVAAAAGCATAPGRTGTGSGTAVIRVAAAENFWGSLAQQLGGDRVTVTSIIDNPNADPHDYEPTVPDARAVALARLVVVNGVGYDTWAAKLADTNPARGRTMLDAGDLVGARPGDNPHRWYDPAAVRAVIDRIAADYAAIDPPHAAFYARQHDTVVGDTLRAYFAAIERIRSRYAGTPVGASESIFAMLAPALGLDLLTPPAFLTAVSEGDDPSAADKATIDRQIRARQIKVYVYNSQNTTPDVRAQINQARANGIPVTAITETPVPAGASFQDWQVTQLNALERALAQATGRQ